LIYCLILVLIWLACSRWALGHYKRLYAKNLTEVVHLRSTLRQVSDLAKFESMQTSEQDVYWDIHLMIEATR